jgi:2-phosphosulfolactate phosphatase
MGIYDQEGFSVRFEWGTEGVEALKPSARTIIVVDVLTFSTAVEVAVSQGAIVFPCEWPPGASPEFGSRLAEEKAQTVGGVSTVGRREIDSDHPYSLSPSTLASLRPGTRLVLASPNGALVSLAAAQSAGTVIAGSIRNAQAVARAALKLGKPIAVIAAGERWKGSGLLRPAFEDLIGAGAILSALGGRASPEAIGAATVYRGVSRKLQWAVATCTSGRELITYGFKDDIAWSSCLNVSQTVPVLHDGAFAKLEGMRALR